MLADTFGERTYFTVESGAMPGTRRSLRSFSPALTEVANPRVSATDDDQRLGESVGRYVLADSEHRFVYRQ